MKKVFVMFFCVILVVSMVLTGCTNQNSQDSSDKQVNNAQQKNQKDNQDNSITTEPGTFPIVKEGNDVTISFFVSTRPLTDDYKNNVFTKWFEEKTNVNMEFVVANAGEEKQKLNLLMNSGDYPDVILGVGGVFTLAEQASYGEQGVLLPLNDMIDKYGVESKKIFEKYPVAKEIYTLLDGNIYTLPAVDQCYHCRVTGKMWIYKPWLDALDLELPTTTEEFYNVLKAFKENDPNGNGKADEIPLAGSVKSWQGDIDIFLMNAFIQNDSKDRIIVQDGKLIPAYTQEGWKEGLKYIKRLYDEGLLAPESFTQDATQIKQWGESPTPILGAAPGGSVSVFTKVQGESGRWLEYITVPALEGPNGVRTCWYNPYADYTDNFYITDNCEYPEVAFRIGDALYNQEIMMHAIYGEEGVHWEWAKEGEQGLVEGMPGVWKELIPLNTVEKNTHWNQMGPRLRTTEFRLGRVTDSPLEAMLYNESKKNYYPYIPDEETIVPPLIFDESVSAEFVDYQTTINEYVDEMFTAFVVGDRDIDAEWDNYLEELDNMGLQEYLKIYQEAYDTKMRALQN